MRPLVYLVFLLGLSSCKYFKGNECNNTLPIIGVYYNDYDKQAEHLLIIKEDGTFEQVFTKGDVVKRNIGTWKRSKETCYMYFEKLVFFTRCTKKL